MADAIAEVRYYFNVTRPETEKLGPGQKQEYIALLRVSDAVWFANKGYGMQLIKQKKASKK